MQLFKDATKLAQLMKIIPTCEINMDLIKNPQARHCIGRMLDKDPETRATLEELLATDWVTNFGRETVNV